LGDQSVAKVCDRLSVGDLNGEAQIIAKSLNLISTKTNFPILFNFFSQKTVRQYLSKPKPLIEIENLIKSTSMIDLWIQAGPNVYYSAGKYPLIKESKIDREKFNLFLKAVLCKFELKVDLKMLYVIVNLLIVYEESV